MKSRKKWLLLVVVVSAIGLHRIQASSWAQNSDNERIITIIDESGKAEDPFGEAVVGGDAPDEEVKAAREEAAREAEVAKEQAREAQRRVDEASRRMKEAQMRAEAAMKEVETLRRQLIGAMEAPVNAPVNDENARTNPRGGERHGSPRGGLGPDGRRPGPPKEDADVREDFVFHFAPDRRPIQIHARTIVGGGGAHGVPHEIREAARMMVDAQNDEEKRQGDEKLGELLEKYFEEDLERRQVELAKIEERLAKLRELVEKRREKKEEIIDLQRKVALNEAAGLGFYQEPGPGDPHIVHPMQPGLAAPVTVPLPPIPPTPMGGR